MYPALFPVQRRVFSGMSALMLFAMCLTLFSPCGVPLARAVVNGQAATLVLGQPDFTTATAAATATGMNTPLGVAVDPTTDKVFVADRSNNRVLRFASWASLSNGVAADGVLGQADFTSNQLNRNGTATANTLYIPYGVTVDITGTLWVADTYNHRVLRFTNAGSRTAVNGTGDLGNADSVLGQADFTSNQINRGTTVNTNTLNLPCGVVVDPATGAVFVADSFNNRVLRFASLASLSNGVDADGVLGQIDFTGSGVNRGSTANANTLNNPYGVTVDITGTLWLADTNNNRVLRFANAGSRTAVNGTGDLGNADSLLGQANVMSNLANRDGSATATANTLNNPYGVAVGSDGTLWVADTMNHRVLRFSGAASLPNGANADGVLGQADVTSNLRNRDGTTTAAANTLNTPFGVTVDSNGVPWVADNENHRVLGYFPSNNANLSSLTLSSGTLSPAFAVGTLSYTASVATIVSSLTVTPTVADSTATVTVNGTSAATPVSLSVGANPIPILVTAQNSNTQTYTLTVTRRSNNANLSDLTLSSGTLLSPVFAPGTTSYTATVAAVGKIAVTPTVTDTTATITVNGTPVITGSASGFSTLNVGANTIPVVVTAEDGNTQTYTVTVTRLPNNADLSNLTLSSGSFSPVFAAATTSYSLTVGNSYTDLALTPTVADVAATVTVSGTLVTSGTPLTVTLAVGANVVPLVVTAQDGTTQSYTLTVTRSAFVWSSEQPALMVLGQSGLGSTAPNGGASTPSRATLSQPTSVTVARTSGKVFVVDRDNHRVMRFASVASLSNGAAAEVVFGQPDFNSGGANGGVSVSASSLNQPSDAVVGDDDTLWIADSGNNRVLRFANATNCATNASADGVLGQPDLTSGGSGTNATTLQTPSRLAIGGDGTLWVADGGNHRVLRFTDAKNKADANGAAADGVLGQSNFNSGSANANGTVAAATLNNPAGMVASNDGTLWVADGGNNRVLRFADAAHQPNGATANGVLGQPNFTSGSATSATTTTLQSPGGLAMSSDGTLWVADGGNNRMVRYDDAAHQPNGAAADGVLGQPNFTSNGSNRGGTATGTSLSHPGGMTVLDGDMLWIADSSNHRVLQVGMPSNNASLRTLTLSSGSLSPTFASTTYTYTVAVGNAITSLSLTPTKGFASATLTVTLNGAVVSPLNLPLTLGPNQIALLVTAQDGITTQTYRLTVTRAGSSNALLRSLTLSSGSLSPSFSPNTLTYVASVANNVMSLTITPTISDPTAILMVDGTLLSSGSASGSLDLSVGPNTFVILVTAQDGTPQTYSLTVTRHSNNANLRSLTLSSGVLSPPFSADTTNYTVTLPNGRTNLTVTPTVADANATVTVNGGSVGSGLSLALGANPIIVRVTAQDGTTTQTYTLDAIRPVANDASLSSLVLSSGTLNPPFAAATTTYTVSVSTNVSGLILTPVVNDPTATVTVNGGSAMSIISLALGPNPLTVRVIAQDGTTTQTYSVIVTRVAASNANLSNLTLSRGMLSPAFATGISTYAVAVANSVTNLTVTPTVSDTTATIKVNSVTVISGYASGSLTLTVGANPVTVLVTAQDGSTQTYTLIVTRAGQAAISITQTYTLVQEPTAQRTALATLSNTLTLTITVGNTGPDAVTGVVVTDNFPAAAVGTVWTWACSGAGGAVCGSANGTGNLNETLKLLPKDGYVTFIVTGSLLNPNHWQNIPHLITPSGVVDTGKGHDPVVVGTYQTFIPLIAR